MTTNNNNTHSNNAHGNRTLNNNILSNRALSNNLLSNNSLSNRALSNSAFNNSISHNLPGTKEQQREELLTLLEALCHIPSPSGQEDERAIFIQDWLKKECGLSAVIDEAKNVLVFFGQNSPVSGLSAPDTLLFMAHTDTVFPDTSPMPVVRTDEEIRSPGVGDDTACAAILMMYLKYKRQELNSCQKSVIFAFNSCEEGLGNLKGSRQILKDYGNRICEVTSFDGGVNGICNHAVGSLRYEITLLTPGGHSYNDFGNDNAIEAMTRLIQMLYTLSVPDTGRNTYNVGTITGGTSVNTIAQSCHCLFEYRSDAKPTLAQMDSFFHETLAAFQKERPGIRLELTLVGERPCTGEVDPDSQQALTDRARSSIEKITGKTPLIGSGSTDCNIPLSLGIPSVCFGGLIGGGVHTREEYVSIPDLLREAAIMEDYLAQTLGILP